TYSATLIERQTSPGAPWTVVGQPIIAGSNPSLSSISASSPTDAWAVGTYSNGTNNQTLIEHWNGSVWSRVNSPNPGPAHNILTGVSAVGPNNAWVVGFTAFPDTPLMLHCDSSL